MGNASEKGDVTIGFWQVIVDLFIFV